MADEPEGLYERIDWSRRYVLGTKGDLIGIWDKQGGDKPVDTFPHDDDGLKLAERRFAELVREDVAARDVWGKVLRWTVLAGVIVWVIAGLAAKIIEVTTDFQIVFGNLSSNARSDLFRAALVLETFAFRLWVGALALLAVLWLARNLKRPVEKT
jgi:hypothetical protein